MIVILTSWLFSWTPKWHISHRVLVATRNANWRDFRREHGHYFELVTWTDSHNEFDKSRSQYDARWQNIKRENQITYDYCESIRCCHALFNCSWTSTHNDHDHTQAACITYSDEKTSNNSRKRRDWRQNISRAFEGCRKQLLNRRIVVVGHHSLVSRSPAVAMALHSSFARSSRLINLRIKSKIFIEIYGMNAHTHTDGTLTENAHCLSDICYFICAWWASESKLWTKLAEKQTKKVPTTKENQFRRKRLFATKIIIIMIPDVWGTCTSSIRPNHFTWIW